MSMGFLSLSKKYRYRTANKIIKNANIEVSNNITNGPELGEFFNMKNAVPSVLKKKTKLPKKHTFFMFANSGSILNDITNKATPTPRRAKIPDV